jgi:prepilin-type N-terminal cleavage/methylation domain-containing protein
MVHAEMRRLLLPLTAKDEELGYTLIELLMVVVLISVLGGTFLRSHSSSFVSYKKTQTRRFRAGRRHGQSQRYGCKKYHSY